MARLLKQSTAFTFRIGPFLDDTDGKTAETGLSIGQADIQISKNGGAFAQTSASPTTTHDADGWYQCPLTATDTNTLGPLTVQVVMSGALPVWEHFMVLPANVYDSLVDGSAADYLQVDVVQMGGAALSTSSAQIGVNVIQAAGTAWGSGAITAASIANGAIDAATFAADVDAEVAAYVWNAATASYGGAGTYGQAMEDALADTNEVQGDLANGGRLDSLIDGIKAKTDSLTFTVAGDVDCNVQSWAGAAAPAMTGDAYARLGAPAGASVSADIAAIKSDSAAILVDTGTTLDGKIDTIDGIVDAILVDTGTTLQAELDGIQADTEDIQTQIGVAGAGLTAVPWNAAWDAEVQSEVFDALDAAFTDATALTSNGLLDRMRTIGWILRNKIAVTDANGNTVIYKDDNSTSAFSVNGMLTDDSTTTTRLRAA